MSIPWDKVQKALSPIKDFEDLSQRLHASFGYPFVREIFNFTLPELVRYTEQLLGGDTHQRYTDYITHLTGIFNELQHASVTDLRALISKVESRAALEQFTGQDGVAAEDTVSVLKYLVYWFIPMEKNYASLVPDKTKAAAAALRTAGIRTNLDLLERGCTPAGRRDLSAASGLTESAVLAMVHWADLSRMPWASKATISNIVGAGYGSMAKLANANTEQLYADFFRYGQSIGKNLKLGNEIENSHRIAKLIPVIVQED
jgi:hypothetical protein